MTGMNWRDVATDESDHALAAALDDAATGWSLGAFGALAEFHRAADEDFSLEEDARGWVLSTPRGALRVRRGTGAQLLPYEGLSKLPNAWTHGVMVCLPEVAADIGGAEGLSELGPDDEALSDDGKGQTLFDIGLGIASLQPCLRSTDGELLALLRRHLGTPFLELPADAVAAIKAAQPERVFISRLGRIEVRQRIPASSGVTPLGPHTHILPQLLGRGRKLSANVPVPTGSVAALAFYPPNPARDEKGEMVAFDAAAHKRFQALVNAFAPADIVAAKQRAWEALEAGAGPGEAALPPTRAERAALRVALRQWAHLNGENAVWRAWRAACEPTVAD